MKRAFPILFLLLLIPATVSAKQKEPKEYTTCKLADMGMEVFQAGGVFTGNSYRNALNKNFGFQISCDGLSYYSYYIPRWRWSKAPDSEWVVGDPIEMREDRNKVFLKRSDGKELKTELIKKVRE